jgi:hypothetical protein
MILRKIVFTGILILTVSGISFSQLSVDGEFRTRGGVDHGYKLPFLKNTDPVLSVDQRSRIILNYKSEKYVTRFTLQDARFWGSEDMVNKTGSEGNSYSFGVYEAWVDLKLSDKTGLKVGRQEWNYDDMRILSSRNWWTSGLSYDGILVHRTDKEKGFNIDLGFSYNNNGSVIGFGKIDNTTWDPDKIKSFNFLNINKTLGEKASVALMLSLSTKVDTGNNAQLGTGTHGVVINYNKKRNSSDGVFSSFSGYYQHGTDMKRGSDGNYRKISAYLLAAELGYRSLDKKLETSIGSELISGRDYSNSDVEYNNTRHTFDLLYSGRFPYYGGNMNHLLVQDSYMFGTKGGGYLDPFLKVNYKFNKKNIINVVAFFPVLTSKVRAHTGIDPVANKPIGAEVDASGNPVYWKGSLGNYFDLAFTHKLSKDIFLKSGISYAAVSDIKNQMVYGYEDDSLKQKYDLGNSIYGWFMLVIKPHFFKN